MMVSTSFMASLPCPCPCIISSKACMLGTSNSVTIVQYRSAQRSVKMRIMTDLCAERYWTIVTEFEVPSMQAFEEMMQGQGQGSEAMKEVETIMKGYHDFVEFGRREVYKIEG